MKVFISYAREDIDIANKLYLDLKKAGISPWMDKQNLLPGQNWRVLIPKAIQESKYFLAVLSSHSLSKKGFVQKELKMALDILEEFPSAEDIFIIPIRIEDCKPEDEKLKYLHWADFFPSYEEGLSQILRVLAPNRDAETPPQPQNVSEKQPEPAPIISNPKPEKKPAPPPQSPKPKYPLRKEPMTTDDPEKAFNLKIDKDGWRRPIEYIQNDLKDNGDGTITDHATGLMWQKSGSSEWLYLKDVPAYIEKLNREKFAGYSDWRLPTVDELKSLLTQEKQSNDLYIDPIFEKKGYNWFWSSDKRASGGAWSVNFHNGNVSWYDANSNYVRAVRSRQ